MAGVDPEQTTKIGESYRRDRERLLSSQEEKIKEVKREDARRS